MMITKDLKKPYPINVDSRWHLAQSELGLEAHWI